MFKCKWNESSYVNAAHLWVHMANVFAKRFIKNNSLTMAWQYILLERREEDVLSEARNKSIYRRRYTQDGSVRQVLQMFLWEVHA